MRVVTDARAGEAAHGHLQDRVRHPAAGRPARAQADRAQPPVQRGEIHARRRPHHGARPRLARRRRDRHPGYRHRHRRATRCKSSAGRSSRSRASSPRPITARAWASPSPSRWSSCTAARCASARRSAPAPRWWCACRSTGGRSTGAKAQRRNSGGMAGLRSALVCHGRTHWSPRRDRRTWVADCGSAAP